VAHRPWNWVRGQFKRGNERGNNLEQKKPLKTEVAKLL